MQRCAHSAYRASLQTLPNLSRGLKYDTRGSRARHAADIQRTLSGNDPFGSELAIDQDGKTVNTPAGKLPLSPLMDASWMEATRRFRHTRKEKNGVPTGRLQRKLARNVYAQILASPVRQCRRTGITVPRALMQSFGLVHNDESNSLWWTPEYLAFEPIDESTENTQTPNSKDPLAMETFGLTSQAKTTRPRPPPVPPRRPSAYLLHRQCLFVLKTGRQRGSNRLTSALIFPKVSGNVVWREDMADFILRSRRAWVVSELLHFARLAEQAGRRYLERCRWDTVDGRNGGCVLWMSVQQEEEARTKRLDEGAQMANEWVQTGERGLHDALGTDGHEASSSSIDSQEEDLFNEPSTQQAPGTPGPFATIDLPNQTYSAKLPVHNLHLLLGEDLVSQLRRESEALRAGGVYLLSRRRTEKLQKALWYLQGLLLESWPTVKTRVQEDVYL